MLELNRIYNMDCLEGMKLIVQEGPYKGWSAGLAALDYHDKRRDE